MFRLIFRVLFQPQRSRRASFQEPIPDENHRPRQERVYAARTTYVATRPKAQPRVASIRGRAWVLDGDTIEIRGQRIRLAGIDAPELHHPWGRKARSALIGLCRGHEITATFEPDISYDRYVATCTLPDGRDLSAEMVKCGLALDWPRFSQGKYARFETRDARKRHWRAALKQRGKYFEG